MLLPVCAIFYANGQPLLPICDFGNGLTRFFYEISHKNRLIEWAIGPVIIVFNIKFTC